ncbi:MAG: hypothetical protein AAF380_01265 [Bacteroidota bacterium]
MQELGLHAIHIKQQQDKICIKAKIQNQLQFAKKATPSLLLHHEKNLYKKYTNDAYSQNWEKF